MGVILIAMYPSVISTTESAKSKKSIVLVCKYVQLQKKIDEYVNTFYYTNYLKNRKVFSVIIGLSITTLLYDDHDTSSKKERSATM